MNSLLGLFRSGLEALRFAGGVAALAQLPLARKPMAKRAFDRIAMEKIAPFAVNVLPGSIAARMARTGAPLIYINPKLPSPPYEVRLSRFGG